MVDTSTILFTVFPYVAITIAVLGSVYRYFNDRFSYSSQSSQFLENRELFWGSVPWHYGIILALLAHLGATVLAPVWGTIIASPINRDIIRLTGPILGFIAAFGLVVLIVRDAGNNKARAVHSKADWLMLILLLVQIGLGLTITLFYRWGSAWYPYTASPWLFSIVELNPQPQFILALPPLVQTHFLNAFLLVAVIPFTRLVHLFTVPITYLWRPYQVVIWNRRTYSGTTPGVNSKKTEEK